MTKGIATDTVIKLALGLVVLLAVGYLLWRYLLNTGGTATESECRAKALIYCTEQKRVGFTGKPTFLDDNEGYPGCKTYQWAQTLNSATNDALKEQCSKYAPV